MYIKAPYIQHLADGAVPSNSNSKIIDPTYILSVHIQ